MAMLYSRISPTFKRVGLRLLMKQSNEVFEDLAKRARQRRDLNRMSNGGERASQVGMYDNEGTQLGLLEQSP